MIPVTFNAEPHWLIPFEDNSETFRASIRKETRRASGTTMREQRKSKKRRFELSFEYRTLMTQEEADQIRTYLPVWLNRRLLVPFWPAMRIHNARINESMKSRIRIWWNSFSSGQYEIRTNANPATLTSPLTLTTNASTRTAPLIRCTFNRMPEFGAPDADGVMVTFSFVEDSTESFSSDLPAPTLTYGASVNGAQVPLLNFPVERDERRVEARLNIKKDTLGQKISDVEAFVSHQTRFYEQLETTCFGDELVYIIGLFRACSGSVYPFWCPHYKDGTPIYGRFDSDELTIAWTKSGFGDGEEIASVQFDFQDLPAELALPVGETYGATIGPEQDTFMAIRVVNQSGYAWLFSDMSTAVTNSVGTFQPLESLEIGDIEEELNMKISDTRLSMEDFDGNPFQSLDLGTGDSMMTVTIYEVQVSNPNIFEVLYIGDAVSCISRNGILEITLRDESTALMDTEGPRMETTKQCKAQVYDARCGLNPDTFKLTRTFVQLTGGVAEFSGGAIATSHLALGQAVRHLSTGDQIFHIVDNYTLPGGNIAVVLLGDILPAPTGAEAGWDLIPGCDGSADTCDSKFSNGANFRGFKFMPDVNPAMVPVATNTGGGKK